MSQLVWPTLRSVHGHMCVHTHVYTRVYTSMLAVGGKARGSACELLCVDGGPRVSIRGPGGPVPVYDALPPSLPPSLSPRRPGAPPSLV